MEIEFSQSKTGAWVPVLRGTLLHSLVNPEKEAENLISAEWASLQSAKSIIVLGLGGGFHIEALLARKNFEILVIEKSSELASQLALKKPELFERVRVLANLPREMIFQNAHVTQAFSKPFAIYKHSASFRVEAHYYSELIRSFNQRTVNDLKKQSQANVGLNRFLASLDINGDQLLTLPMIEEAMHRRGTGIEREGYIWMTMRELIS